MLDLRRLVTFCEAARRGSFAAAADELCFTPSAVSQQMSALERDVGSRLFRRTPRGVALTGAGERLLEHAEALLDRLAVAEADLKTVDGGPATVRLGSFASASAAFVALAVERFRARHPSMVIGFFDAEPSESLERLACHQLDLAVVYDFDSAAAGPAAWRWLFEDPCYVVLPRGHRLMRSVTPELDDLRGELILGGSSWTPELTRLCRRAGFEPGIDSSWHVAGFDARQVFVAAGRGITLLPRLELGRLGDRVCARPLAGGPVRQVRLATSAAGPGPAVTGAVLETLEQAAGELGLRGETKEGRRAA